MKHTLVDDLTVIDFGAHFYPEGVPMPDGKGNREIDEIVGLDRMFDPETVTAEMEEASVDAMVHTTNSYLGHDDAEATARANDALFEYIEEYDEFYGLAALPIGAGGEDAAAEFERSLEKGYNGGGLHETDVKLTDQEMEPVLEVADQTGAPLFIHILNLPNTKYRFNATFGRERGQQESISRVIHDGIYDRYPNLNIVWHHLGGNIAAMLGRIHLQADPGRWASQESMKPFPEFKADLENRVYVDSCGFFGYTGPIRTALEEFPSTQVLFGTDYPWEPRSGDEIRRLADAITESGNRTDAKYVLGQNALDIMVNID